MASPFAVFREKQRTLMALLFIFAMFGFILADAFSGSKSLNLPMFGMVMGVAVCTIIGAFVGKPIVYAAAGAIGGLLVGTAASQFVDLSPNQGGFSTAIGTLTSDEIQTLVNKRSVANEFMQRAVAASGGNPQQVYFYFGMRTVEEDVLLGHLFRHMAAERGMSIDGKAVQDYISRETNNKLKKQDIDEILSDMRTTHAILIDDLRQELLATLAAREAVPRPVSTPAQYWENYKKLHESQSLQTVAIPVDSFADSLADPGDAELLKFFEAHKDKPAGRLIQPGMPNRDSIGLRQPRQIQLAYLEASYLDLEQTVPPVTDAEIDEFYEQNKEILYKRRAVPEDPFGKPGTGNPNVPFLEIPDATTDDAAKSPDKTESEPGRDAPATPDADKPELPKTDEPPQSKDGDKPAVPSTDECFDEPSTVPDPASADETPPPPADSETPLVAPKPGEDVPEYQPLDEFLREQIRDRLLTERTQAAQEDVGFRAIGFMSDLSTEYVRLEQPGITREQHQKAIDEFVISARKRLKEFAQANNLIYRETPLLDGQTLFKSGEHPIGAATIGTELFAEDQSLVTDHFFALPPTAVYTATAARGFEPNSFYAAWKTADVAERIPQFTDPGIREQTLAAWKQAQARPLAEKRANELAERLKKSDKDWTAELENQTITGEAEQVLLTTRVTEPFSWYRLRSVPHPQFGMFGINQDVPELSTVSAIDEIDDAFMETIFRKLQPGEVGVVPNAVKSMYYIVQVRERNIPGVPTDGSVSSETLAALRFGGVMRPDLMSSNMLSQSPYVLLEGRESARIASAWMKSFREKYRLGDVAVSE